MRTSDWSSDVCSSDLGLVGKRLRIGCPCHRHRRRAGHIAEDDWRLDAARTVALDPAIAGKGEAGQKLAEVFHHIVSFGFAMHQDVKADFFLKPDDLLAFVAYGFLVARVGPGSRFPVSSHPAGFGGLGKYPYGGGCILGAD